ncbi:helix-turn-helix domain-containing protein [Verrucomicrobiaceae bacterium 227]
MARYLPSPVSHLSNFNIPEHATPQKGVVTPGDGHFYYGDHSDGFEFPAKKVKPHRHPYFEIFWFPDPSGGLLSDFRTFTLSGPCLVFISPGQIHGWPGGADLKGEMIAFDEAFIDEADQRILRSPLFYAADASPVIPVVDREGMSALWKQLEIEFSEELPDQATALQSLLRILIITAHRLADVPRSKEVKKQSASSRVYQSFIKLLSGDIVAERLPKHYAQRLGVSADSLSESVRKSCGHTAGELIRRRVTLECKRLLAHSDLTISEIAYFLHFKDPSYFSRFFKKHTGLLPKAFRDRN